MDGDDRRPVAARRDPDQRAGAAVADRAEAAVDRVDQLDRHRGLPVAPRPPVVELGVGVARPRGLDGHHDRRAPAALGQRAEPLEPAVAVVPARARQPAEHVDHGVVARARAVVAGQVDAVAERSADRGRREGRRDHRGTGRHGHRRRGRPGGGGAVVVTDPGQGHGGGGAQQAAGQSHDGEAQGQAETAGGHREEMRATRRSEGEEPEAQRPRLFRPPADPPTPPRGRSRAADRSAGEFSPASYAAQGSSCSGPTRWVGPPLSLTP